MKSVRCVHFTNFWELKDYNLSLDSPPLLLSESWFEWGVVGQEPVVAQILPIRSLELKLSCSNTSLCAVFPEGKMKSFIQQVLNSTSTY